MGKNIQNTLFNAEKGITIGDKLTCEEINEYYKTHTLLEAIRSFHHRPNKLNIDPELKKEDAGLGRPLALTRVQVVFLKSFTKKSDLALSQLIGVSNKTVAAIEREKWAIERFILYLFGIRDFCKVVAIDNKRITEFQSFNLRR